MFDYKIKRPIQSQFLHFLRILLEQTYCSTCQTIQLHDINKCISFAVSYPADHLSIALLHLLLENHYSGLGHSSDRRTPACKNLLAVFNATKLKLQCRHVPEVFFLGCILNTSASDGTRRRSFMHGSFEAGLMA